MTAISDRPQMLPEQFEEFARHLGRTVEGIRLEFINGKLGIKPVPDGDHGRIIQWLNRICIQARPELYVHDQGLKIQGYRGGFARPDGTLADADAFVGRGDWATTEDVLMVAAVTSFDSETDRRDRVEKPRAYAEASIPVYLLIDRDSAEVVVHSQPDGVRYESVRILPFGKAVHLPEPVGISLDTEPLKNWVR
ncbi:Uma2 family endonuclease [Streptomyces sp. 1114.5]|uniref:Uma2 family endonuclease n=1 Tax=Streptomyces sp. 1114.5 TaxID=1938830 RepID=UPI000EB0EB80|nr:Uma2 family endonuclease [Streptomyces sp. 1114.5]RKT18723.1 Uma2 family endonuclease [Streptomyces sp. 1114.5]